MSERVHPTDVQAAPARDEYGRRAACLAAQVGELWPAGLPSGRTAGLPTLVADVLRPGRRARPLPRVADELDRTFPGWVEVAAQSLRSCRESYAERLCLLLAQRPLRSADPLLRELRQRHPDPDRHLWLLVALAGTDTPEVRAEWRRELRRAAGTPELIASPAAWFAFARAALGSWLTWEEFRDWLTLTHALSAPAEETDGGYRPALERVGLWSQPTFAKWYRQVVYEVVHQPDADLSFAASAWVRDFPGSEYLFHALTRLGRTPYSWWPLHVLRWTSEIDSDDEEFLRQLRSFPTGALCLLSLLRPDLAGVVGRVLDCAEHEEVVQWLLTAGPSASPPKRWLAEVLTPHAQRVGETLSAAVGVLTGVEVPPDYTPETPDADPSQEYVLDWLVPTFRRLLDNSLYLMALRKEGLDSLLGEARRGKLCAVRALGLWPEQAEQSAPVLFALTREGRRTVQEAAREALAALGRQLGVSDLARFERRVDFAVAWSDAGLEGRPARAWWDLAGRHVRLSVALGEVKLAVYEGTRRLPSVPAELRRHPEWCEIRRTREELAKSYRYFRRRFEQAMVEGLAYRGGEFATLLANPVVRSLVSRLVLDLDGRAYRWVPEDPLLAGEPPPEIAHAERVLIAHPISLRRDGGLRDWQQRIVEQRVAQPFKQVFREVYLLSEGERELLACARFVGHQVVARRAFALLRGRGYSPGEGDAMKEWPVSVLRAHIEWAAPGQRAGKLVGQAGATRPVSFGDIWFESALGDRIALGRVPPIVFSETLRDADLTISLAAHGESGFTSEETRHLRGELLRHLVRALGLHTVYVSEDHAHALVDGTRALYRVHLGSGSVLLEKSRRHLDLSALSLSPIERSLSESVDSLTARIIGTIVALSQDDRIEAPSFLRQLE